MPAVFIYDGHSGGVGLTRKAFSLIDRLLEKTLAAVRDCPCELGCPSCVHSPKCGSGNRPIDKECCLALLDGLLRPAPLIPPTGQPERRGLPPRPGAEAKPPAAPFTLPRKFGVFDVETKRSADDVGGWHQAERMGISLAVVYDGEEDRFFMYREDETKGLVEHLFSLELVVGFNNKRFDNRVLSAYTRRQLGTLPALDILEEITSQLGYRLSLDRLAEHTLNVKKEGNGLLALQWFRQGRMDLLAGYCRKDVEITRDLFLFGLRERYLLFRSKAGSVVRLPVDFQRKIDCILKGGSRVDYGQTSLR